MQEENIKTYIIDASFIIAFLLPDESVEYVDKVFAQYRAGKVNFISSPLLPFEIVNTLKEASRKRIKDQQALGLLTKFLGLIIEFESIDYEILLKLSMGKNLSAYDASYLYLSQKNNLKLLTLDDILKKLAK